jgi:hypothetical protein
MALSWVSVNANDGSIIADLPTLRVDGSLKRTIGRYETQTANLPFDKIPANWKQATRKKAVFLVALDESGDQGKPVWGGMVIVRTTSDKESVGLSLVTAEDCLNDRYVGNENFSAIPQNTIVRTLVEKYMTGYPLRVVELPGANPTQNWANQDQSDKTLFSALDELSGVAGGPEWTVDWEWVGSKLGMVLYVGARIGSAKPDGLGAAAQFYLPGNLASAELTEGYRRGEGANDVMATSSGAGNARPQSPRQIAGDDLRPRVEFRWSPATNQVNVPTLTTHAQRALADMREGTVELAMTANRAEGPKLGVDWNLGDDIGFDLTSWAWPDGITGTARVVSIEFTDTTITPVLDVAGIEGID